MADVSLFHSPGGGWGPFLKELSSFVQRHALQTALEKSVCNSLCLLMTMTYLGNETFSRTDSAGDFGPILKMLWGYIFSDMFNLGRCADALKGAKPNNTEQWPHTQTTLQSGTDVVCTWG